MLKKVLVGLAIVLGSMFVASCALACEECYHRHGEYRPGVVRPPMYEYRGPEYPPHYRRCDGGYGHRGGWWGYGRHRRPRARIEIII